MKKQYRIFIILAGLSLACLFVFYVLMKNRKTEMNELPATAFSRVMRNIAFKTVNELENKHDFRYIFGQDRDIAVIDETGAIFTIDYPHKRLTALPPSDLLKNRILDIFIRRNDDYLILDGTLGAVYRRTSDSTIKVYEAPFQIIRGEFIDENNILIKASLPEDPSIVHFMTVYLQTGEVKILEVAEPEVEHPDMTLDGFLVSGANNILHVCYKTGLFSSFSKSGRFQYTAPTLDESPPPVILVSEHGTKRYNPYSSTVNLHATSDDKTIFILSNRKTLNDFSVNNIVDCYDIENGRYTHSFTLQHTKQLSGIVKTAHHFIGIRANQVLIFKEE